jgi:hypothetical protein
MNQYVLILSIATLVVYSIVVVKMVELAYKKKMVQIKILLKYMFWSYTELFWVNCISSVYNCKINLSNRVAPQFLQKI